MKKCGITDTVPSFLTENNYKECADGVSANSQALKNVEDRTL